MSEPLARVEVPAASVAPEPPLDPPTAHSGDQGLRVMPHSRVWVKAAQLNSGVVARAWTMPPAARTRSAIGAVWSATSSRIVSDPLDQGRPSIGTSSFIATGRPSSARASSPAPAYRSAASRACSSASS